MKKIKVLLVLAVATLGLVACKKADVKPVNSKCDSDTVNVDSAHVESVKDTGEIKTIK